VIPEQIVPFLRRFWARSTAARTRADVSPATDGDLRTDNILLAGLKLGIRETLDFLLTSNPSFEVFEQWVLGKNDGAIETLRAERLNGALCGDGIFVLESILSEPVLSPVEIAFWDENGYVVVKHAATPAQCLAAVAAIFDYTGMSIENPDSWYGDQLWIPLAHHAALWDIRNSARIHTAFAQIWRRKDLWMNVDVCGVNPPERDGYSFHGTPLHWDMSLATPLCFGTQAILYLTDTAAEQGAFSCVPGFHRKLEAWLGELPAGVNPREQALKELQALPIAGDAGDLIIWNQALPHGATPNRARLPRVVQYMNMFPNCHEVNAAWL
jgi:hypothetical protein